MSTALTRPPRCGKPAKQPPDNDRLLLLTVAVILVQNRAPTELILALLYAAI